MDASTFLEAAMRPKPELTEHAKFLVLGLALQTICESFAKAAVTRTPAKAAKLRQQAVRLGSRALLSVKWEMD